MTNEEIEKLYPQVGIHDPNGTLVAIDMQKLNFEVIREVMILKEKIDKLEKNFPKWLVL